MATVEANGLMPLPQASITSAELVKESQVIFAICCRQMHNYDDEIEPHVKMRLHENDFHDT